MGAKKYTEEFHGFRGASERERERDRIADGVFGFYTHLYFWEWEARGSRKAITQITMVTSRVNASTVLLMV